MTAQPKIQEIVHDRPPPRRAVLIRRLVIMSLLLILVLGGLYGFNWYRSQAIKAFFASNVPPPTPVAAAEAKLESVPKFLAAIGTLQAVRQVMVAPEIGGRVEAIFFEAGGRVKASDPLLQINDRTEQAELQAFRAQARLAETNLARARELLSRQAGPQVTVDQARAALDEANANIERTQAVIAKKLLRAPFEGELGLRQVNLGQYLEPAQTVVTLTDLSRLYVNFTLPEQARPRVASGQEVRIRNDAFPGRNFEAKVTAIEPQVSADTRTIRVQATMENPERLLLPGMFANVEVVLPPEPNVVTVPETAVDYTLYGDSVFLIKEEQDASGATVLRAIRTPVKTGDRFDNKVAILEGLQPGQRVAASGQLKLSSGAAVTLSESGALAKPAAVPTY